MTTFKKALYFHDYVDPDDLKLDIKIQITKPCDENDIHIKKLLTSDIPDFRERDDYEVLFFDWGGMSLGNSMMESFCFEILKLAEDRPNTFFVMVSRMTTEAMKEAQQDLGKDSPFNVFLTIDDFGVWCRKWEIEREKGY